MSSRVCHDQLANCRWECPITMKYTSERRLPEEQSLYAKTRGTSIHGRLCIALNDVLWMHLYYKVATISGHVDIFITTCTSTTTCTGNAFSINMQMMIFMSNLQRLTDKLVQYFAMQFPFLKAIELPTYNRCGERCIVCLKTHKSNTIARIGIIISQSLF